MGKNIIELVDHYLKIGVAQILVAWHPVSQEKCSELASYYQNNSKVSMIICTSVGQVQQRQQALANVAFDIDFILLNDDDLKISEKAFREGLDVITRAEIAALSFTIERQTNFIERIFPGKVLSTGYNCYFSQKSGVFTTDWVSGGKTLWRRKALMSATPLPRYTNWAIGEDLHFSGLVQKYRLVSFYIPDAVTEFLAMSAMDSSYRKNKLLLQSTSFLYTLHAFEHVNKLMNSIFVVLYIFKSLMSTKLSRELVADAVRSISLVISRFLMDRGQHRKKLENILINVNLE